MSEKQEVVSEALKAEESLKSQWHILTLEGDLVTLDEFDFKGHKNLQTFSGYEVDKDRSVTQDPPHVGLMKSLELVDYEPASDPGNMRYYPKGRMVKALLEEFVTEKILDYGGMAVETPIMYDMNHPTLAKYLNRFPARQYTIEHDDARYFLRFAACFGQFLMAHDAVISYRNLPLRIYELTRYSFRKEQRGELAGLRRLRAFTMPDVHALCRDLKQGKKEFMRRYKLVEDTLTGIGFGKDEFEMGLRMTEEFWKKNKRFVQSLVRKFGKPALLELWKERSFYFVLKYDLNFIDALGKASALATDQFDVENGKRYGISYMDKDGREKHPLVLHCSPSGAIERDIYALLEKAHMGMRKGIRPSLPLWLAPTQIRMIPVSEAHIGLAKKYAKKMARNKIRADYDDRPERVQKKIRDAEKEWIPYIVVLGEKEVGSEEVPVRMRSDGKLHSMSLKDLASVIKKQVKGKPYRPVPLPISVQSRPKFVG
ncbi:MAG: threonine--tRNA ligase [Candidatus Bathyarchaeota archaeon]|jgi:threonyl-tRNA synthetase|nr:threonine--tRNA ligase [Candidatus Bathyarchaeota archaeon]MDP7443164.1 threonine--tRNA ligase [Candidatus Bathyarchaeota archaeon]